MQDFATMPLPAEPLGLAPDGSAVRPLLALAGGSLAHFTLPAGQTSIAVTHRTVEELWFCLSGTGEMWRRQNGREEVVTLTPGLSLTIPLGNDFQFRAGPDAPFTVVIATMPPWPGPDEAYPVPGRWTPSHGIGVG